MPNYLVINLFDFSRQPFLRMPITKIHAREIYDSRGNPTVEVDLYTDKGERVVQISGEKSWFKNKKMNENFLIL